MQLNRDGTTAEDAETFFLDSTTGRSVVRGQFYSAILCGLCAPAFLPRILKLIGSIQNEMYFNTCTSFLKTHVMVFLSNFTSSGARELHT